MHNAFINVIEGADALEPAVKRRLCYAHALRNQIIGILDPEPVYILGYTHSRKFLKCRGKSSP